LMTPGFKWYLFFMSLLPFNHAFVTAYFFIVFDLVHPSTCCGHDAKILATNRTLVFPIWHGSISFFHFNLSFLIHIIQYHPKHF
jgi:hypothetical protein